MDPATLVDSSIFIELLGQGLDPATELTSQISLTDLATCGMIRIEVLRGIRNKKIRQKLSDFMDVLQNVPTDNRLWDEAAHLAWKMDRVGWVIPAQDILIACCAMRIGASVLTRDRHFSRIPGLVVRSWPV
jgi:predicted nucleic acid-binding protein